MPNLTLSLNTRRPLGMLNSRARGSDAGRWLINAIQGALSGTNQSDGLVWNVNDDITLGNTCYGGPAVAGLIMATSSGAVGGTIGGTLVTVTWATSDTASSTALAAAIRANSSVNRKVTATNQAMRVTLASVTVGQFINICNTRFTAVGATPTDFGTFDQSGTDTQDAASLCQAINRHPSLALRYRAINSAGQVFVVPIVERDSSTTAGVSKFENISNPGGFSTFTIGAATLAAGAMTAIIAATPGDLGNECRLTASGTNVTALTNGSAGFLGHGTGGGISMRQLTP